MDPEAEKQSSSIRLLRKAVFRGLQVVVELVGTVLYHEMLKRNTLRPIEKIINEQCKDRQLKLLREWAESKANEAAYIQVAGGFLFTTVVSCLQWPGTQNGHWSAAALFYTSILYSLVAIVTGSQQMLVLPNEKRFADGLDEQETKYLRSIVHRLQRHHHDNRPSNTQMFALQTPMMLLSFAVVTFFAGLVSVIFAPLARQMAWDGDAKTAVVFGVVSFSCITIFFGTSFVMHWLFDLQYDRDSRIDVFLETIRP